MIKIRAAVVVFLCLAGAPAAAQDGATAQPAVSMDTASLGGGRYSRMHHLLEKTIFKVDVLTAEVRLGADDVQRIERLAGGLPDRNELADSIAEIATHSQDALVRVEFVRDVSLDQFLDGVQENLSLVPQAGLIPQSDYQVISEGLPRWFGFLEERGIYDGDQIVYRIQGDALRTQFIAVGGELLLDQTDTGSSPRLSVLGSYFVRGSDFREGLLRSLFE